MNSMRTMTMVLNQATPYKLINNCNILLVFYTLFHSMLLLHTWISSRELRTVVYEKQLNVFLHLPKRKFLPTLYYCFCYYYYYYYLCIVRWEFIREFSSQKVVQCISNLPNRNKCATRLDVVKLLISNSLIIICSQFFLWGDINYLFTL